MLQGTQSAGREGGGGTLWPFRRALERRGTANVALSEDARPPHTGIAGTITITITITTTEVEPHPRLRPGGQDDGLARVGGVAAGPFA